MTAPRVPDDCNVYLCAGHAAISALEADLRWPGATTYLELQHPELMHQPIYLILFPEDAHDGRGTLRVTAPGHLMLRWVESGRVWVRRTTAWKSRPYVEPVALSPSDEHAAWRRAWRAYARSIA